MGHIGIFSSFFDKDRAKAEQERAKRAEDRAKRAEKLRADKEKRDRLQRGTRKKDGSREENNK